jgi:hypothetical protein
LGDLKRGSGVDEVFSILNSLSWFPAHLNYVVRIIPPLRYHLY